MQGTAGIWGYLKRAIIPAICIMLVIYFLSFAIGGPTGVLSWRGYQAERKALAAQVAARAEQKASLERQVELLDPAGVDPDLADELVRRNLNVVRPDEVIVPLDEEN
ncbi:FtsB family cell division protein [Polymorphobacter sp.]|uniref:FtsB family cell division protein n=1 Tax=Polymorphobacter sp. TaxID=1909290 RepID=UPI003F6F912B